MAGSYNHIVNNDGTLMDNDRMMISGAMIENLGDAYEAIEELYGMIWFLAWQSVAPLIPIDEFKSLQYAREMIKDVVMSAQANYTAGLTASTEIHRLSPDRRHED